MTFDPAVILSAFLKDVQRCMADADALLQMSGNTANPNVPHPNSSLGLKKLQTLTAHVSDDVKVWDRVVFCDTIPIVRSYFPTTTIFFYHSHNRT